MEISKAAAGLLIGACITAGAGGAYFATRQTLDPLAQETRLDESGVSTGAAVEQSEAVLAEAPDPEERPARPSLPQPRTTPTPPPSRVSARQNRETPPAAPERPERPSPATESTTSARQEQPISLAPIEPPAISDNQPSRFVEPPGPEYEELVVAADSVIGLELESTVTSERARVEDQIVARVTRDVKVGDRVAIPAGSRAHGEVTLVERGGRLRDRARLGVRFTSVVLADGTRVPLRTETIYREGDAPGGESAAKIGGGAIGGAIIGGILGGAKGAAIGGSVGAGAGSAAVLAGGRNPATLSAGSPVTVRVEEPATVTVEK